MMTYQRIFSCIILLAIISWSSNSLAAFEQCPAPANSSPAGWTTYKGQFSKYAQFSQAIIMRVSFSNVSCIYNSPPGQVILQKYGTFKPEPPTYWGMCPTGVGKCCMNSIKNCTFVQTSPSS